MRKLELTDFGLTEELIEKNKKQIDAYFQVVQNYIDSKKQTRKRLSSHRW